MINFENAPIAQLPDVVETPFEKIHKDYLKVILINFTLFFCFAFLAIFIFVNFVLDVEFSNYKIYFYVVIFALFTLKLFFTVLGFYKRKYLLRERDISYKSGVLYKTITTVPFSRVQHVEVDEAPLARLFKLASISVFTAGDSSHDIVIKGIKKTEALRIKEFISKQIDG